MPPRRQPRSFPEARLMALRALKFGGKLDLYRRMKGLSISALAEKVGIKPDRMEDLLEATHEPRAGDIIRIQNALDIRFDAEDFE